MTDFYYTARLQCLAQMYLMHPTRLCAVLQRAALRAYPAPNDEARAAWLDDVVRWDAAGLANDIDPGLWAWRKQQQKKEAGYATDTPAGI